MSDGTNTIEWVMLATNRSGEVTVKQVDKSGTYRVSFDSADLAGSWIIHQVDFCHNEMSYKFISS